MLRDMIGLKRGTVKLVKHESDWKEIFEAEKNILNSLIKDYIIDIQHIGSTSIPGIDSKPIIDILIGIKSLDYISNIVEMLESNGFMYCPESGTNQRVLFIKEAGSRLNFNRFEDVQAVFIDRDGTIGGDTD